MDWGPDSDGVHQLQRWVLLACKLKVGDPWETMEKLV